MAAGAQERQRTHRRGAAERREAAERRLEPERRVEPEPPVTRRAGWLDLRAEADKAPLAER